MKIIDEIHNINNGIWNINGNVVVNKERSLINLGTKKVLKYDEEIKRCFYSNDYLFLLKDDGISILDENLNLLNRIDKNNAVGISIFDQENYAIWFENEDEEEYFDLYSNAELIGKGNFFYGKFLSKNYCYRFRKRKDLQHFRLTDLLDNKTYFEYQCEEGYELASEFYIWQDTLVFKYFNEDNSILEQRDIKTGKIIWKTNIQGSRFIFDEKRGLLASIWGKSGMYADSKDQYQIINLNTQTVEIGSPLKDFNFTQVESHMETFLYDSKLYFSDNPFSYAGEEPNPIYVGCFDIESKKVDFIQAIPEMAGSQVAQIIRNGEKLYVRSSNGDLIVYDI